MTAPDSPTARPPLARPDVRAFLDYVNALPGPRSHEAGAVEARRMMTAAGPLVELPVGPLAVRRDLACPGPGGGIVPLRLYDARADRGPGPVMIFIHGGGFVIGDLASHEPACAEIARTLDIPVISVDYRLAPEHPFPAAPDDCEAAARWIASGPADLGFDVTALVLAGDSAGGNLAIVTTLALRDAPAAIPVIVQWPIYPTVDKATGYASFDAFADDYFLTRAGMKWFGESYAADADHWRASPLLAPQAGMPATLVVTAGLDPLRDQGRAYAAATIQAGVPTMYREAAGNIHGFLTLRRAIPSSQADLAGCLTVLKTMIAEAQAAAAPQ